MISANKKRDKAEQLIAVRSEGLIQHLRESYVDEQNGVRRYRWQVGPVIYVFPWRFHHFLGLACVLGLITGIGIGLSSQPVGHTQTGVGFFLLFSIVGIWVYANFLSKKSAPNQLLRGQVVNKSIGVSKSWLFLGPYFVLLDSGDRIQLDRTSFILLDKKDMVEITLKGRTRQAQTIEVTKSMDYHPPAVSSLWIQELTYKMLKSTQYLVLTGVVISAFIGLVGMGMMIAKN